MASIILPIFVGVLSLLVAVAMVAVALPLLQDDMRRRLDRDDGPDPSLMFLAILLVTFLPTTGAYLWSVW